MPDTKPSYLYGPVPSRRLGFSLGIDIIPFKICTFNCIYCQIGRTTQKTLERKPYVPVAAVLAELREKLAHSSERIDYLTISGSGEPTLNSEIGTLIQAIKQLSRIPIAVLTNGSLLGDAGVQRDLARADVVLPTLCAADQETFTRIHRPVPELRIDNVIAGMVSFRRTFKGAIWLEVMVIKGINDTHDAMVRLRTAIERINPDRIQINTVVRPPSETFARQCTQKDLEQLCPILGPKCEVIADFQGSGATAATGESQELILQVIKRRPVTADGIARSLGLSMVMVKKGLHNLQEENRIRKIRHAGQEFFEVV